MFSEISIRPSKDIRNNYAEISKLAQDHPVAITVNGREDTVVMSHEQFMSLMRRLDYEAERAAFVAHLQRGADDVDNGRVKPMENVFDELKKRIADKK